MTDVLYPAPGSVWQDADGYELTVHRVAPGDRDGREVRGRLLAPDGEEGDYSTDQEGFVRRWRDRLPVVECRQ